MVVEVLVGAVTKAVVSCVGRQAEERWRKTKVPTVFAAWSDDPDFDEVLDRQFKLAASENTLTKRMARFFGSTR